MLADNTFKHTNNTRRATNVTKYSQNHNFKRGMCQVTNYLIQNYGVRAAQFPF